MIHDYDHAVDDFSKALSLAPNDANIYSNLGMAYRGRGDYQLAIAALSHAIELRPKTAAAYDGRGATYVEQGDYDRAIQDLDTSLTLDPRSYSALNNRGNAYNRKHDFDQAIADYSMAMTLNPKFPEPHLNRGEAYRQKGDFERALKDYNAALALDPKSVAALNDRGLLFQSQDKQDAAIADFEVAEGVDPKNSSVHYALARSLFLKNDLETASREAGRSIELRDRASPMLLRYIVRARHGETAADELRANAGRLKEKKWPYAAIELFLKDRSPQATLDAAETPSDKCEAQFFLGEAYALDHQSEKANAAFDAAIKNCPVDSLVYALMSRKEMARAP